MKILMTGATGLIGREVGKILAQKGHEILVVSRSVTKAKEILPFPCDVVVGDLSAGPLQDERLQSVEAVINLMGEPVVGARWSDKKKESIYNSRVIGTRHLIASLSQSVRTFISGSAVGFYGSCSDEFLYEDHSVGKNFLAKVCLDWEREAGTAPGRKIFVRTGIVLAKEGGALDQMLFPFRAGVGGVLGEGKHWMSWIHLKDIVGIFVFALENPHVQGAVNGVAPLTVTNKEFSETLARSLGKNLGPRIPEAALKLLFGEVSQVMLSSIRGSAEKIESEGYQFHFKELSEALAEICAPFKAGEEVFYAEQFVPAPPEKIFSFFQDAHNLEKITPPTLNFHIERVSTPEVKQGTLIDYRLKIHGVPAVWKTEIDEWQPPYKFVDNQLRGPYRLWHHTHEFRPFCGGTLLVDRVRYRLPMGYVGWLMGAKFVRQDVENIFAFRRKWISKNWPL